MNGSCLAVSGEVYANGDWVSTLALRYSAESAEQRALIDLITREVHIYFQCDQAKSHSVPRAYSGAFTVDTVVYNNLFNTTRPS